MNNTSKRAGIVAAVLIAAGLAGASPAFADTSVGPAFADTSVSTAVTHQVSLDRLYHDWRGDDYRRGDHDWRYDHDYRRGDRDWRYDNDRRRDNDRFGDRDDRFHHYPIDYPRPRHGWWHR